MLKSPMATVPKAIPVSESLLRREAVDNAIADLRLEGLAPSPSAIQSFERFVDGDISEEELLAAILRR